MSFIIAYIIMGLITNLLTIGEVWSDIITTNCLNWKLIIIIIPLTIVLWPVLVVNSIRNDIYQIKRIYHRWNEYKNNK